MVRAAIETLQHFNALDVNEELTPLGYHLSYLSVDIHVAKLMLYGAMFRCVDAMLTM
jgi:HrpA-like RNA helicase